MQTPVIQTTNLNFSFSNGAKTLDNINLLVPQGSVYGFLGPNGAGKTTTIRLLLGLLPNPKNNISLFEQSLQADRIRILSKTGSLIEQPSLYEHLSGFDNLEITRAISAVKKQQIERVLDLVDLKSASKKK